MYEPKRCSNCVGRGWTMPGAKTKSKRARKVDATTSHQWPVACDTCGGRGMFTMRSLAKLLDEGYATLCRVDDLRAKPDTAKRIFRKLVGRFEFTSLL